MGGTSMTVLDSNFLATSGITRRTFVKRASMSLLAFAPAFSLMERAHAASADSVVAETAFGKIRGVEMRGVKIFKGVPYGDTTTGQNRFMPAKNPVAWTGTRDALDYGPSTPQLNPDVQAPVSQFAISRRAAEGEDCLVLNIWTPGLKDGGKRPVMFWLHGGGFVSGSGSAPEYDG